MRKVAWSGVLGFVLWLAAAPCGAEEQFTFYGFQFGATKADIAAKHRLDAGLVRNPGHGMSDLELVFDREELLMEIRANWPRPDDPFQYQGLLRALREKFVAPTAEKFPSVTVTLDEYSNRAAVRVVFLSSSIRERNIDFHKGVFLKTLQ